MEIVIRGVGPSKDPESQDAGDLRMGDYHTRKQRLDAEKGEAMMGMNEKKKQ